MLPCRETRLFPALLRYWRAGRGLSQLDLALAADVSARHLSFLETGRARPSREMVLRLAATLDVPLRDQNALLEAAGHSAEFAEPGLDELAPPIAQALARMLAAQEPYPMTILDRRYDLLRANASATSVLLRFVVEPAALPSPLNGFAFVFDPSLARPFILGWERLAHDMAARLHREVLARPQDAALAALLESLFAYPDVPDSWRQPDFSTPSQPTAELRLRKEEVELGFLTTITAFSAPQNVTLEELRIESYFPLDAATARACEQMAVQAGRSA